MLWFSDMHGIRNAIELELSLGFCSERSNGAKQKECNIWSVSQLLNFAVGARQQP